MNDWIQTYTGRRFRPLAPCMEDIDVDDIAHALSLQCRFNGHCRAFYSVAEHSVRVAKLLPENLAIWGLLHDAAEAYLGDLPSPLKHQLAEFQKAEAALLEVVAKRFALVWPMPDDVVAADRRLLVSEARDLMGIAPEPWDIDAVPIEERIIPWTPEQAERELLGQLRERLPIGS